MKKDIVMFKKGSFVDFQGLEHQFVVCALSTSNFQTEEDGVTLTTYHRETGLSYDEIDVPRAVFVGIAVCNPGDGKNRLGDEWDENKGKMIAEAKARGFKPSNIAKSAALFATRAGMISEALVKALLDREVEHVKEDPEYVIKGYNQMKARWEERQELNKYIEETDPELVDIADKLKALPGKDIERVINVALIKSYE